MSPVTRTSLVVVTVAMPRPLDPNPLGVAVLFDDDLFGLPVTAAGDDGLLGAPVTVFDDDGLGVPTSVPVDTPRGVHMSSPMRRAPVSPVAVSPVAVTPLGPVPMHVRAPPAFFDHDRSLLGLGGFFDDDGQVVERKRAARTDGHHSNRK